jgi:hypothetical protein
MAPPSISATSFSILPSINNATFYRNGCIGGAVAPLPRIGCSFQGTANFDLRQARLVLSYFGFRFFSVWAEFEK